MVALRIVLRRDGHVITWDSVPNDELLLIMAKIKEKFDVRPHTDGNIVLNASKMVLHLNKEFPITVDETGIDLTGELVGAEVARELYKERGLRQPSERYYKARYMKFVPRNQTNSEWQMPPEEPEARADRSVGFVLYPENTVYMSNGDWNKEFRLSNMIRTFLKNKSIDQLRIEGDRITNLPEKVANKLKGGTIVYDPDDTGELGCAEYCRLFIK